MLELGDLYVDTELLFTYQYVLNTVYESMDWIIEIAMVLFYTVWREGEDRTVASTAPMSCYVCGTMETKTWRPC